MNDQYEQLLMKMYISNTLLLAELQFQKSRKPKAAKLCQLLNGDFLMNFDRYMIEIEKSNLPKMADPAVIRAAVEFGDNGTIEKMLLEQQSALLGAMAA